MRLEGQNIILRDIVLDDAERFVFWLNDPNVYKFMATRQPTLEKEKTWIESLAYKKETDIALAIETKAGKHIGSVGLHKMHKENRNAEMGIMIGDKDYWEKGYGKDAMRVMLDYAFKELRLHRVELGVYAYNPRAIHVYESLGFKREGIKRERTFYEGKFYDEIIMGMLAGEWLKI